MPIDVSKLRAIVEADTLTAEERLRRVSTEFDRMGKTAYTAADRSRAFSQVAQEVTVPLAALSGAGLAAGAALFQAASRAEQTQIAFTTMLGSGEAATAMLGKLRDFAATTPFQYNDLTQYTQRLMAMGVAAQDVVPMMTDVGDAVAGLGAGNEGIERVTRAFGQMLTRGKTSAQDMLQLTEVGIPAWRYLAEAIGVTTGEVQKMSEKGVIPAAAAIDAIRAGMQADFGGLMALQAKTASGQLSNLKDSTDKLAASWGTLLLPAATDVIGKLQGVTDALDDLSPAAQETVLTVGGTVTAMSSLGLAAVTVGPRVKSLGGAMLELSGVANATAGASLAAGAAVAAAAVSWAVAIGMIVDVVNKWRSGVDGVKAAIQQHSQDIVTSSKNWAEYRGELERVASEQGYLIDAQGNLINGAGTLIQTQYSLTESQYAAKRSIQETKDVWDVYDGAMIRVGKSTGATIEGLENLGDTAKDAITPEMKAELEANASAVEALKYAMGGAVGNEMRSYADKQLELTTRAGELKAELEKLEGAQGKQYSVTTNSTLSANELTLAQLKLADAQTKLSETTDPLKQAQLQVEIDKLTGKIAGASVTTTGYVDNSKRIGEVREEYLKLNDVIGGNAKAHEDATKRILFSMLEQQLAVDGFTTEERAALTEVAVQWGLIDQATADAMNGIAASVAEFEKTGSLLGLIQRLNGVRDAAMGIPKMISVVVKTTMIGDENFGGWVDTRTPKQKGPAGPPVELDEGVKIGGANGLDMIVPPGYPNDSFPVWAQSGERVTITPPGRGGAGGFGPVSISVSGVQDPELAAELVVQKLQDRGMIPAGMLR